MNVLWETELHNSLCSSRKTITYNYHYLRTDFHGVYDVILITAKKKYLME